MNQDQDFMENIPSADNPSGLSKVSIRIALVLLAVIILYIVYIAWDYFSKDHLSIYEVNQTSISDNSTITAYILRNEKVVKAKKSGYINFYHADQSKIGVGDALYTIDSDNTVKTLLSEVDEDKDVTQANISMIREIIMDYYKNATPADYSRINDLHYNVENMVFEQSRSNLYSDLQKKLSDDISSKIFTKFTNKAGIISYSIDGYEKKKVEDVNDELFSGASSVERSQLRSSEEINEGDPVCKIVQGDDWQLAVPLTDQMYLRIKEKNSIRVTVKKDNISFNCSVSFFQRGDTPYALLTTRRFMGRYLNERFLDIQFNLNSAQGLKVPNSSIFDNTMTVIPKDYVTKGTTDSEQLGVIVLDPSSEKGTFQTFDHYTMDKNSYLVSEDFLKKGDVILSPDDNSQFILKDTKKVKGVYCVNTGYTQFMPVETIYENNEYTIVSANTQGGIANYDHIVVNPLDIKENSFVNE